MKLDYKNTQAGFQAELKRLARVRERLTRMLARVDERIKAVSLASEALRTVLQAEERAEIPLAAIADKEGEFEITATIRDLLRSSFTYRSWDKKIEMNEFSAPQIRDRLVTKGWKADQYDNALAVIHTVLKRLIKTGDVERGEDRRCYRGLLSEAEREVIISERQATEARKTKEHYEQLAQKRAMEAARAASGRRIERLCREVFLKNRESMSIEAFRQLLLERGIDLSNYATPWSGITRQFWRLGINKQPNGLWSYETKGGGSAG